MTLSEFAVDSAIRPCLDCGYIGLNTRLNPNNNGLLVVCPRCDSKRPWGSLLYLKQNETKRRREPLPNSQTLDSIWEQFGNRCVMCSAPKSFLEKVGIGRQVHHVAPYAEEQHRGPLVPICVQCHAVATERQRVYWFIRRIVMQDDDRTQSTNERHESKEGTAVWPEG